MTAIILRKQALKWRKQWKDRQHRWYRKWDAQLDRETDEIVLALKNQIDFNNWKWNDESKENRKRLTLLIKAVLQKFGGKNGLTIERMEYLITMVIVTGTMHELERRGEIESKKDSYGRYLYKVKPSTENN